MNLADAHTANFTLSITSQIQTTFPFSSPQPRPSQVRDILKKMTHPGRQTLLFSATMPTAVAEFTRAGLKDPEIIRLDAENKISDKLEMAFIRCRDDEKDAALLFLVKHHIPATSRCIIFAPTKHHVEFAPLLTQICAPVMQIT